MKEKSHQFCAWFEGEIVYNLVRTIIQLSGRIDSRLRRNSELPRCMLSPRVKRRVVEGASVEVHNCPPARSIRSWVESHDSFRCHRWAWRERLRSAAPNTNHNWHCTFHNMSARVGMRVPHQSCRRFRVDSDIREIRSQHSPNPMDTSRWSRVWHSI